MHLQETVDYINEKTNNFNPEIALVLQFCDANISVIAIGTDKQNDHIITDYRIEEEGKNIDT